jgi:protein SCO1/2/putative membrane protein
VIVARLLVVNLLFFATFFWIASPLGAQSLVSLYQDIQSVGSFSLSERYGKTIANADLRGKVWIAHFFFTTCKEGCAQTTQTMARLQDIFRGKPDVALVSISLNPQDDTPEVLRDYANHFAADAEQWLFLYGPESVVHDTVQKSFFHTAQRSANPSNPIDHSFNLLVVDRDGVIRGYVNGKNPDEIDPLVRRVRELAGERYRLPAVNAVLNSLCAVFLVSGYLAIRRRREGLHKACMLSALAISVAFLTCYLYFHFVILDGQPTRFRGEGWIRPAYFAILLSHTVLAVVVAPLALTVAYLGLRDRRATHRKLARWTLPVWLYVSITGVVVYLLLYQVYPPY